MKPSKNCCNESTSSRVATLATSKDPVSISPIAILSGSRKRTVIRPHHHYGALLGMYPVRLVCVTMPRIIALLVGEHPGQACLEVSAVWHGREGDRLNAHFIPHLPVTGVKKVGISCCSTCFRLHARTKMRSMTLSG